MSPTLELKNPGGHSNIQRAVEGCSQEMYYFQRICSNNFLLSSLLFLAASNKSQYWKQHLIYTQVYLSLNIALVSYFMIGSNYRGTFRYTGCLKIKVFQ
jgi:hypothetical protein